MSVFSIPLILARYVRTAHRLPRLSPPVTYNEHITHRLLFDRDPRLKVICDKIAVKAFVDDRIGKGHSVPLLGAWTCGEMIDWSTIPAPFVLKPSFASGPFEMVHSFGAGERDRLTRVADQWVSARPALRHYCEWGYHGLPKRVMAEPLLVGRDGGTVPEVNVFVFGGRAMLLRVFTGQQLTKQRRDAWFDRDGRQIDIRTSKIASARYGLSERDRKDLIALAEAVAQGFSSLRVDFYVAQEGLLVGELTPYSWGGHNRWAAEHYDDLMGTLWSPDATTSIFESYAE